MNHLELISTFSSRKDDFPSKTHDPNWSIGHQQLAQLACISVHENCILYRIKLDAPW